MSGLMQKARGLKLVDAARSGLSGKEDFDLIFKKAMEYLEGGVVYKKVVYKALRFAAQNGNLQLVTLLLEKLEACPYFIQEDGELFDIFSGSGKEPVVASPVFVAVQAGHLEIVRKLINSFLAGRNPKEDFIVRLDESWLSWFGQLVQWAVRWGHASIVEFLVRQYQLLSDPSADDDIVLGRALYLAAFHGHSDVMKVILECDSSAPSNSRKQVILEWPDSSASNSRKQVVSSFSMDGLTALHLAAQSGFVDAVKLLVGKAEMDATEGSYPEDFTPLHLAANFGHVEVVNFLLTAVSRINILARDCLGRTALHYAAREGHVQVVQALVNAHEDIALVHDDDDLLPLHMAARAGHVEVIKALNPFGGIMRQAKHSLEVKSWVERDYTLEGSKLGDRCSLSYRDKITRMKLFDSLFWKTEGFTPLHFAARYGNGAAVEELLKNRDAGSSALFMQDSGGFLAYDWMKVQEQGKALVASCCTVVGEIISSSMASGCRQEEKQASEELLLRAWQISGGLDVDLNMKLKLHELELELELEKRSSGLSTSGISASVIAEHVREEKKAVEELKRACGHSGVGILENVINRIPIVQWLLEDVREPCPHGLSSSTTVKPYGFHALDQALLKDNFVAAKHILLHYPGVDLSLDGARVIGRVKSSLAEHDQEEFYWNPPIESFLIVLVTREELALGAGTLRLLARWAKDHNLLALLGVIMDRSELKRGLYEDRQLYVDCANAMLVGAALIAGVAFQGWLAPPLGYSYEYEGSEYAAVHEKAVRAFWWSNNGAFFLAVASLIAGAKGAVPVRHETDIMRSLEKVRRAVGVASSFLGMALICVVGAFTAAGFAVLPPLPSDLQIMQICVGCGTSLCALVLLWFGLGVLPLVTETIRYVAPRLKDFLVFCVFSIPLLVHYLLPFHARYRVGVWLERWGIKSLKERVLTRFAGIVRNTHSI